MKTSWKLIGFGFLGGMLPLSAYMLVSKPQFDKLSDEVIDGNRYAHAVNYDGNMAVGPSFVEASESTINSVVHVTTKVVQTSFQRDLFQEFFYGPGAGGREFKQYGSGSGSGVIISSEGYIVTNNHVAVLKIEGKGFQPIKIGDSDNLHIGEWVLAVGNPFNLTSTVTAGIVSAKARNINLLANRNKQEVVPIESFIQTDAAVNPGNSGGALVNTRGELVGINTAIASQTGSYAGYSFAVPVNLVQKVMRDLIDYGIVQRGFLGVEIADISQEVKETNKLPSTKGVFVSKVNPDGSADAAGIKDGDVILKIGTKDVNSVAELQEEIGKRRPGDKVALTILQKDGDEVVKSVVLRNKEGETKLVSKEEIAKNYSLGATFTELTSKEKRELNITFGVKIASLNSGKLKAIGLQPGMIITKVNNEAIESVEQLTSKLNGVNKGVLLEVLSESGKKDYYGFGL
jgi:S1-C subfamily serine protease